MVSRVFVNFSVVQDVVSIGRPSSCEPLVSMLVHYSLLGVVVVNVVHGVLLHLDVLRVIVNVSVFMVAGSTESSNGLCHQGHSLRSTL